MNMTDRVKRSRSGVLFLVATAATAGFLLAPPAVEAGWKPKYTVAATGGIAASGLAYSLNKNWRDLLDRAGKLLDASIDGDSREVDRNFEDIRKHRIGFGMDAFPVLSAVSKTVEGSRAAGEQIKKRLSSITRRVGEFLDDPRAALSVGEDERQWYESESGVLDRTPLPAVGVAHPSDSRERLAADRWEDDDTASTDWDSQGSNPVGEYALRCGNVYGIGRYSVFYAHWKRLMEKHSGDCPDGEASDARWSAVLEETSDKDPWAPDEDMTRDNPAASTADLFIR